MVCVVTGLAVVSLPCDTDSGKAAKPRCDKMVGMDLSAVQKAEAQTAAHKDETRI